MAKRCVFFWVVAATPDQVYLRTEAAEGSSSSSAVVSGERFREPFAGTHPAADPQRRRANCRFTRREYPETASIL